MLEEYKGQDIGEAFRRRYFEAILRAQGVQVGEKEGEYSDEDDDED